MTFRWTKTERSLERLIRENKDIHWDPVEEQYYYGGRLIIHRDSPIDGGVYLSEGEGEAIVVDSATQPLIRAAYDSVKSSVEEEARLQKATLGKEDLRRAYNLRLAEWNPERLILETVYNYVKETTNRDIEKDEHYEKKVLQKVGELLAKMEIKPDQEVKLENFLEAEIGVCKHMALTMGVLLEMFQRDGLLDGKISVDRNYGAGEDGGGHAWCRYTSNGGEVYILDAAQGFFGTMGKILEMPQGRLWDYRRPDENWSRLDEAWPGL